MEKFDLIARIILGLLFFVFGFNGFLNRLPIPVAEIKMQKFVEALQETGYLMNFVKGLEILVGICFLTDYFVGLALVLTGPLVFIIVSAQLFLNGRRGWGISFLILGPFLILLIARWNLFQPLMRP